MKKALVILGLLACSLIGLPDALHGQQEPTKPKKYLFRVNAFYDKKKDVTTLSLQPLELYRNKINHDQVLLYVSFQCPKKTIVKPAEVSLRFNGFSSKSINFTSEDLSVVVDGDVLTLRKLNRSRRGTSFDAVYEDATTTLSYEDFSRLARAEKASFLIGNRQMDLSELILVGLRQLHDVMQREGQEIK